MTSGNASKESELAVDAFIAEPYTAEKLLKAIHSVLQGKTK